MRNIRNTCAGQVIVKMQAGTPHVQSSISQSTCFAKAFISASKTPSEASEYKIWPECTVTQLCQIYIKITRCAARCSEGARRRSHTLPSPHSPLPTFTSPPLSQRHVRSLCPQTASTCNNWCTDSCSFSLAFLFFFYFLNTILFPLFLPFTASIHPLRSFPFLSCTRVFLLCTFPQADIKAGPVGGRGLV